VTEKYLARLIRAKHPGLNIPNDDNGVVCAYAIARFSARFGGLEAMTDSEWAAAVEKSETLDDFDREFLKLATA
jgi:hypothetical protein